MKYSDIQNDVIRKYRVKLDPNSSCWGRTHVHIRERRICKWCQKNGARSTFDLLHEVGHIMNNNSKMRRCEEEYHATVWAIDRMHEYGFDISDDAKDIYQRYIDRELDRGKRRGGAVYPNSLNLKW